MASMYAGGVDLRARSPYQVIHWRQGVQILFKAAREMSVTKIINTNQDMYTIKPTCESSEFRPVFNCVVNENKS